MVLFPYIRVIIGSVESKRKFSENPGHNILAPFHNLVYVSINTTKTVFDIWHIKLSTRVASQVAEQLRTSDLRKLGNIRKMSNVGVEAAQCPVFFPVMKR